jgi:hypothetical protein
MTDMATSSKNGRPYITLAQLRKLKDAFENGASASSIAGSVGVHRNTAINYFRIFRAGYTNLEVLADATHGLSFMITSRTAAILQSESEKRGFTPEELASLLLEEIAVLGIIGAIVPARIDILAAIKRAKINPRVK